MHRERGGEKAREFELLLSFSLPFRLVACQVVATYVMVSSVGFLSSSPLVSVCFNISLAVNYPGMSCLVCSEASPNDSTGEKRKGGGAWICLYIFIYLLLMYRFLYSKSRIAESIKDTLSMISLLSLFLLSLFRSSLLFSILGIAICFMPTVVLIHVFVHTK